MTAKIKGVLARAIGLRKQTCGGPDWLTWYIYSRF